MTLSGSAWRSHPFEIVRSYVETQAFLGEPDFEFVASRGCELLHIGHSHYDGCRQVKISTIFINFSASKLALTRRSSRAILALAPANAGPLTQVLATAF